MYRKKWTSETEYQLQQMSSRGYWRDASEESKGYLAWIADGNVPGEVAYVAPPVPPVPTLEQLKEQKKQEIAAARYEAETGGMEVNGAFVRTDRESQSMLTAAVLQAIQDSEYTCQWKTASGWVTMDTPTRMYNPVLIERKRSAMPLTLPTLRN
jgi:hypothetical protein